jgi:regulator of protease activity HflC (stomatin/prohibitin superfamily)
MDFLHKPRTWIFLSLLVVAGSLVWLFWVWEIERIEVPPGKFLVKIHLWGTDLDNREILAPDEDHKGIMLDPVTESRVFLNPLFWSYEMHPLVNVPTGKCLILTRKYGKEIPKERQEAGDFLARDGERGIVATPLLQGDHRINPHAYDWKLVDAVPIATSQVGVRTLKVGLDPKDLPPARRPSPYLVPEGYRGVQEKPMPPGTYYLNPYVEAIVPVDVQSVTVRFTDIKFPSTDGFMLNPHVLVKYYVEPERAPELLVTLTDEGHLNQGYQTHQDQEKNQVLQKVVLPLIRGYVRIEGSKFDARDFIARSSDMEGAGKTNPRERLQEILKTKVPPLCKKAGVIIEEITLDQMDPRDELAELARQISEREQARLKREQNKSLIEQYRTEQLLKANEALKEQEAEKVQATTKLDVARKNAEQRKKVEEARLKQDLANTQLRLEAAKEQAKATLAAGKADADVIHLQNDAEVSGLRKAVQGFPSADAFAQYHIMAKLAPALTEIFASDGSDFAKLFAGYLAPATGKPMPGTVPTGAGSRLP